MVYDGARWSAMGHGGGSGMSYAQISNQYNGSILGSGGGGGVSSGAANAKYGPLRSQFNVPGDLFLGDYK